jgi:hypothetical protein
MNQAETQTTVLTQGDETLRILFSSRRNRVQKEVWAARELKARSSARGDLATYRREIASSVKWGWTIESTDQEDMIGYDFSQSAVNRRKALREAMYDRAEELNGRGYRFQAEQGYAFLVRSEPHRTRALHESLAKGRTDDVIRALVEIQRSGAPS